MTVTFLLLLAFSYFVGSIPFGVLFGRLFADVDVRDFGSGNIGATNVNRVLGRKLGALTLLCDSLKGLIPVLLGLFLLQDRVEAAWIGLAAFLGHIFPIYLKFKGGKGVATMFGVLFPLSFLSGVVGLLTWISVVKLSKISSMGALSACVVIPIAFFVIERSWPMTLLVCVMTMLVAYRHKENIARLRAGTER
jgi:glycerol-3-phosphate acyltransferase PlsY